MIFMVFVIPYVCPVHSIVWMVDWKGGRGGKYWPHLESGLVRKCDIEFKDDRSHWLPNLPGSISCLNKYCIWSLYEVTNTNVAVFIINKSSSGYIA
jgi:hypothetical protein